MKKKTTAYKLVLWVLFGFAFISTIHAIVEALIFCYLHYGLSNGFLDIHFQYYIPAFSILMTFVLSILTILSIKKKLVNFDIEQSKLPWFLFFIFTTIAISNSIITKQLSDQKVMLLFDDLSKSEYLGQLNLVNIFNTIKLSSLGSQWLIVILFVMATLFLKKTSKF